MLVFTGVLKNLNKMRNANFRTAQIYAREFVVLRAQFKIPFTLLAFLKQSLCEHITTQTITKLRHNSIITLITLPFSFNKNLTTSHDDRLTRWCIEKK